MGIEGAKNAFEENHKLLGLRFGGSISSVGAGQEGKEYFVQYPLGSGQEEMLEFHIRKGASKDERVTLAIYFFYDEDTNQVVVGWLPSHLDNRMT